MSNLEMDAGAQRGLLTVIATLVGGPRRMNSKEKWYDVISTRSLQRNDIVQAERDGLPEGECRADDIPELKEIFDELYPEAAISTASAIELQKEESPEPSAAPGSTKGDSPPQHQPEAKKPSLSEVVPPPAPPPTVPKLQDNSLVSPPKPVATNKLPEVKPSQIPVRIVPSGAKPIPANTVLKPEQIGKTGIRIAAVTVVGFVILCVVISQIPTKGTTSPSPPSDPMECAQRLPTGQVTYFVARPRTPVRDQPTAQPGSGSNRIGFHKSGDVVQGEWVPSPADKTKCWLKINDNAGYISEINLSSSAP